MYNYLEAVKADIEKKYLKREIVLRWDDADFIQHIQFDRDVTGCFDSYVENEEEAKSYICDNLRLLGEAFGSGEKLPCYEDLEVLLENELFHQIDIDLRAYVVPVALEVLREKFENEPPREHRAEVIYTEHGAEEDTTKDIKYSSLPEFLKFLEDMEATAITVHDYWKEVEVD